MKLSLQICFLTLCVAAVYAKYKTEDFTNAERMEATLQGIAHAEQYIQSMEKAKAARASSPKSAASLLKNFFRKASAKSVAMGKARIKMEKAVKHAERILLEKKRLETAKVASKEEQAEAIAYELYHKPGSILGKKELARIYQMAECEELRPEPICSRIPFYHSLRTISGVCNNLEHPTQGASFTPFQRLTPPVYFNGIDSFPNQANEPDVGAFAPRSASARFISDTAVLDREDTNDTRFNHIIMQWGQFMDHDLDLAVEFGEMECDLINCVSDEICAPIRVPNDDEEFGVGTTRGGNCLPFQRTVPACIENPFEFEPREQVNELTHYIDGSMVYGSTDARAEFLREMSGGRLKVSEGDNLPTQPPCAPEENPLGEVEEGSNNAADCCPEGFENCGVAGDIRALEHVSLTVIHTVWVREHNRVAEELQKINPTWSDDRTYFEARNVIIAEIQQITFNEYLSALFGSTFSKFFPPYAGYNEEIDASIPNVFATAAYRFGHSQIQPFFARLDSDGNSVAGPLFLRDSFFSPTELENGGGVESIVNGWVRQRPRIVDEFLNSVLTTQLFENPDNPGDGMDLAALNIQRGRDHGLPRYGVWRRFCEEKLGVSSDFLNELTRVRLANLYENTDEADLFVAALAEMPLANDSALGAILSCIFSITFTRLRDGDRFWYENEELGVFLPEQLEQIRRTSFARVLCDVGGLTETPVNVFLNTPLVDCNTIEGIDFTPWEEPPFCYFRSEVTADEDTLIVLSDRPTGTRRRDIRSFYLSSQEGARCVPFRCPTADVPQRDIIATVPRDRRSSCTPTPRRRRRRFFLRRAITADDIDNEVLFDSVETCEAGSGFLVTFSCDGAEADSKMASTSELEDELARALGKKGSVKKSKKMAKVMSAPERQETPNFGIFDEEDLRNVVDGDPQDDDSEEPTTSAKAASKTHKTKTTAHKEVETEKLINLLQATLQELKHNEK